MRSSCLRLIIGLTVASAVSCLFSGCASTGISPKCSQLIKEPGKLTILRYSGEHAGDTRANVFGLAGAVVGTIAKNKEMAKKQAYVDALDEKCISSIQKVLLSSRSINYVDRTSVGLSGSGPEKQDVLNSCAELHSKYDVTSMMKVTLNYGIGGWGFQKPLYLRVSWELLSSDGKRVSMFNTDAASEKTHQALPNTLDPQWEETFIELAEKNAENLLLILEK